MVKTSIFFVVVVLTFVCIELLLQPYDYVHTVKPDRKHGERRRRFTLPQSDAMLLAQFRSNATSFIMSIVDDYNSTEWDNPTHHLNNSFAILLPNHIMLRVYTAFLDNSKEIRASFPENITPFRNLSYLFDVDIFTAASVNSTAPIINLNKVDYVVIAHGLINETNILIAMQRPDNPPAKYDRRQFNYMNRNKTQNNKPRNPPPQPNLGGGVITYPIKRYIYHNPVIKANHVLQTQKNRVVQYPSTYGLGQNDNWNTFSGYKHLPKQITIVTYRPNPNRFYRSQNLRSSQTSITVNSRSRSTHVSSSASFSRSGGSRGRGKG